MTPSPYTLDTMADFVGREFGVGPWETITQARIQAFAECTGDRQWIHVDAERCARESPFGMPVAHGYLTLALIAAPILELGLVPPDAQRVMNLGANNVRFRGPVRVSSRVRVRVALGALEAKSNGRWIATAAATVEVESQAEPALTADVTLMLIR